MDSLTRFRSAQSSWAARIAATALGRDKLVESILTRTGRPSQGVSLALSIRSGAEPDALATLLSRFRTVRWMAGSCRVFDDIDRRTWWQTDTYRASLDRRSVTHVAGQPLAIPELPVRAEHAARRCIAWLDDGLAAALRRFDVRRLRGGAFEMWNAYATAAGLIAEPLLLDEEVAARCDDERLSAREPSRVAGLCFEIARRLHERLLPPLKPLPEWQSYEVRMPPDFRKRTVSIVPDVETPLPAQARRADALTLTPQALHLYLEYLNPFAAAVFPAALLARVGIEPPSHDAFVRACRNYGASFRTRMPGFESRESASAAARMRCCLHAIRFLREGRTPPALPADAGESPRASVYYGSVYPLLRADCEKLWSELEWLGAEHPAA